MITNDYKNRITLILPRREIGDTLVNVDAMIANAPKQIEQLDSIRIFQRGETFTGSNKEGHVITVARTPEGEIEMSYERTYDLHYLALLLGADMLLLTFANERKPLPLRSEANREANRHRQSTTPPLTRH